MQGKNAYSFDDRRSSAFLLLELAGCLLKERTYPKGVPEPEQIEGLYRVSKSFGMAALADRALRRLSCQSDIFDRALEKAQRRSVLFDAEYRKLVQQLESAGVYCCPLKGMVIKHLYPMIGLREMDDIDIFVRGDRGQVRRIMISLGYQVKLYNESNHDVYIKPSGFCIELHFLMIDGEAFPSAIRYYQDYAERLIADAHGSLVLSQSREDCYIYLIVHMYKHYILTGIGVRSIVDIAVYLAAYNDCLDMQYIAEEIGKLGIPDFERQVRELSEKVFDPQSLSEQEKAFLDDFILCGAGGSKERYFQNRVKNQLGSKDGIKKWQYVAKRLRIPKKALQRHPILAKHKILTLPYAVYRLGKAALHKKHDALKELRAVIEYNDGDKRPDKQRGIDHVE